jgi:sugar phosphate isomerase/epimerase
MVDGPMIWGYAGVFPGAFRIWDGDAFLNKYRFLTDHGFRSTGIGLGEALSPERRDFLRDVVAEHGLVHSVHFSCPFFTESLDALRDEVARYLDRLWGVKDEIGAALITVNVGPYHRFMREPPLAFQMRRLGEVLTPLAEGAHQLGLSVGLENHCDYLVTDILELCGQVPHLGLFWDTGNSAMSGENPLDVSRRAAPRVVGTHFKDFFCAPDESELKFVVKGASLGDGDIGLEQIYRDLAEARFPSKALLMEFELIPDAALHPWESLERSKRFVERISGFPFRYPAWSAEQDT